VGVDRGTLIFLSSFFCVFCTSFVGAETIRVASYNVENYLVMDRMVSGRWQEEYPKPLKERRIIRSVINQTNPDILAIQEIGERVYLDELWEDLNNTNGTRFKYAAWLT